MLEGLQNIFRIPELKRRVIFTIALLCVYRLGGHIPTPGVNGEALVAAFAGQSNSLFGLYDLFVGGSFAKAAVFARCTSGESASGPSGAPPSRT